MNRRTDPVPPTLMPALRSHLWFASCPEALQEGLLELGRLWSLRAGETLFARGGDDQSGLCCVVAGALKVGSINPRDGTHRLSLYLEPYQWVGEIALIDRKPRSQDAVADTDATVLVIPQSLLEPWLDAHPQYWRDIARLACGKLRLMLMAAEDTASMSIEQQLARRLVFAATSYGHAVQPTLRKRLRLPQEYLARMLGVSRQTINKALKSLAADRIIAVHYAEIEILDAKALATQAGQFDAALWSGLEEGGLKSPGV
ncbi:MAG: Crp/Fnr family transcriptional regulator [Aquabacterium sp.]|uniref:Crp/Fnr family transcriptional regulator n=1 Tax=Aquabacterium sp. TaxID=1872578 RepID=UPI00271DD37A|nr:Crp/Fnr family transcriptional regulator [Aquabacterium sp.]MDO9005479.1 Crp/Fnr family transcriptional regulator [Aquabacterium sp.]